MWVDGAFVPWADATIHLLSQSVQRGSLVFDVMQVFDNDGGPVVFGLAEHIDRFINSARLNGMALPLDREALIAAISATVATNAIGEIIKICAYYPTPTLDVLPADEAPSVAIAVVAFADFYAGAGSKRARPLARLQVATTPKMPADVLSPQLKIAASYTHSSLAKAQAKADGFHDVLLLDANGNLAETASASVFVVVAGELLVPTLDTVLAGVTRAATIDLARRLGLTVREQEVPASVLASCDEAFIVSTSNHVWPVGTIDERVMPEQRPVSEQLAKAFNTMLTGADAVGAARWLTAI